MSNRRRTSRILSVGSGLLVLLLVALGVALLRDDPVGGELEPAVLRPDEAEKAPVAARRGGADEGADAGTAILPPSSRNADHAADVDSAVLQGFSGRVLQEDGKPLADAVIEVLELLPKASGDAERWRRFWDPSPPRASTRTDGAGRYSLSFRGLGRYRLRAAAPGYATEVRSADPETGPHGAPLDIVLRRGGDVAGMVVDETGREIPGATVLLVRRAGGERRTPQPPVQSGPDGTFRLGAAALPNDSLAVRAAGFAQRTIIIPEKGVGDIEVRLTRGVRWRGRVFDGRDRRRAAGVTLLATQNVSDGVPVVHEALSDAQGRFEFDSLVPRQSIVLRAEDATRILEAVPPDESRRQGMVVLQAVDVGPGDLDRDIYLAARSRVTGVVVSDEDGRPLPGIVVRLIGSSLGDGAFLADSTPTDAEGRFRIDGAPNGPCEVELRSDTWTFLDLETEPGRRGMSLDLSRSQDLEGIRIHASPRCELRGRVVDEEGRGVAEARIEMRMATDPEVEITTEVRVLQRSRRLPDLFTDPSGAFRRPGLLPQGRYLLRARSQNALSAVIEWRFTAAPPSVELVLHPSASFALTLLMPDGNPAVARSVALVAEGDPFGTREGVEALTDDKGRLELQGLAPGVYNLSLGTGASMLAIPSAEAQVLLGTGRRTELKIRLSDEASISGWVRDIAGHRVGEVAIRATPQGLKPGDSTAVTSTRSQADGFFRLEGLKSGLIYRLDLVESGGPDRPRRKGRSDLKPSPKPVDLVID